MPLEATPPLALLACGLIGIAVAAIELPPSGTGSVALPVAAPVAIERRRPRAGDPGRGRADRGRGRVRRGGARRGPFAAAVAFTPSFAFVLDGAGPAAVGATGPLRAALHVVAVRLTG